MEKNKKTNVTFKQHVQQHWEKNRYVGVILVWKKNKKQHKNSQIETRETTKIALSEMLFFLKTDTFLKQTQTH